MNRVIIRPYSIHGICSPEIDEGGVSYYVWDNVYDGLFLEELHVIRLAWCPEY